MTSQALSSPSSDTNVSAWSMVMRSLARPYPVSVPMVLLLALVPFYIFIGEYTVGRTLHVPALAWDRALPVEPSWALVYGSLYLFLIVLPVFVVRQEDHMRRTVWAYLLVWITAYVCFLVYPTVAPRPASMMGGGFAVWGLRFLYWADPPTNCFPSLHVAHSFVSALACYPVHRRVGIVATGCALLVALSTLYAKQHYILDVVAGILLASVAYLLFLRGFPRERVPELDRRVAPVFAVGTMGIVVTALAGLWVVYWLGGKF